MKNFVIAAMQWETIDADIRRRHGVNADTVISDMSKDFNVFLREMEAVAHV